MRLKLLLLCLIVFIAQSVVNARFITMKAVKCPACNTINHFQSNLRFNHDPFFGITRYHYFSQDYTENQIIYCCKTCNLAAFFWDFKKIPRKKARKIKNRIKKLTADISFTDYQSVPFLKRLQIAEKVYENLDKDDFFWCTFYRIMSWHFRQNDMLIEAFSYRNKALKKVRTMLKKKQGIQKELLMISGLLHFFWGEDKKAYNDFISAMRFPYYIKRVSAKKLLRKEKKLDLMIRDFIGRLEKK